MLMEFHALWSLRCIFIFYISTLLTSVVPLIDGGQRDFSGEKNTVPIAREYTVQLQLLITHGKELFTQTNCEIKCVDVSKRLRKYFYIAIKQQLPRVRKFCVIVQVSVLFHGNKIMMYANINNISYLIEILKYCSHFMSEEYEAPRSLKIFQEKTEIQFLSILSCLIFKQKYQK